MPACQRIAGIDVCQPTPHTSTSGRAVRRLGTASVGQPQSLKVCPPPPWSRCTCLDTGLSRLAGWHGASVMPPPELGCATSALPSECLINAPSSGSGCRMPLTRLSSRVRRILFAPLAAAWRLVLRAHVVPLTQPLNPHLDCVVSLKARVQGQPVAPLQPPGVLPRPGWLMSRTNVNPKIY